MEIATGWIENAIEKGIEKTKENEPRSVCLRLLRKRLGVVDADTQNRIEQLTVERLEELGEASLEFNSPSDLIAWFDAHCPSYLAKRLVEQAPDGLARCRGRRCSSLRSSGGSRRWR